MPEYRINADFDHDGRLSGSAGEYNQRQTPPGAVVTANLDADARPTSGFGSERIELDHQREVKARSENDLMRFTIRVTGADAERQLFLRTLGWLGERVRIYDQRGRRLRGRPSMPNVYPISVPAAGLVLALEAPTLPGTPLFAPSGLRQSRPGSVFRRDEGLIRLELYYFDEARRRQLVDWALVSIAPLILMDNTMPAHRVFICEVQDPPGATTLLENQPSITDVESALRGTGVPLVRVPHGECQRDGWIQDQFKIGYTHTPGGVMNVVLHYPRMMSNALWGGAGDINLARFVRNYFPARQIGNFEDFWQRRVRLTDAEGSVHLLNFRDTQEIVMIFSRLYSLRSRLVQHLKRLDRRAAQAYREAGEIGQVLTELPQLLAAVVEALAASNTARGSSSQALQALIDAETADLREGYRRLQTRIALRGARIALDAPSLAVQLTDEQMTKLSERLSQMHDASNYGGNFDVSPPVPGASFGKIVFGNSRFLGREYVDPDLTRFLANQQVQPLVEIDASWLHIGHIDELVTFAPSEAGNGDFAILRASPAVAIEILHEAARRHLRGLAEEHLPHGAGTATRRPTLQDVLEHYSPRAFNRTTNRGSAPITQMLRGKKWLHHHTPDMPAPLEPPLIYRNMMRSFRHQYPNQYILPYEPGEGPDRTYPANINVFEFIYSENQTNADIDSLEAETGASGEQAPFMQAMDRTLASEFPGVRVIKLPVLFDAVVDWFDESASAFTPNPVNMQIVNGRALVPRPFGPRMRVEDTIAVLRTVLESLGDDALAGRLSERWFTARNLIGPRIWVRDTRLNELARQFSDGFAGQGIPQIERLIRAANQRGSLFNRASGLRPGWHMVTIPEDTVDLFEAYTQVMLEAIGLDVRWVDSWYYHILLGEIHCGTNVQRSAPARAASPWWEAAAPRTAADEG